MPTNFAAYLETIGKAGTTDKLVRVDFLQPDEKSVAFSIGNETARGYMKAHPTNALVQSGSLSVSLQNGKRRSCSLTISNADAAFDFAVNKIWFGSKIRLMMGVLLPNGTPYYIPQGVFVISEPQTKWSPNERSVTYSLLDKWAMLDGTIGGKMSYALQIDSPRGNRPNVFDLMAKLLAFNKFTLTDLLPGVTDTTLKIDPVAPLFTDYYNNMTVQTAYSDGSTETVRFTDLTYDLTIGTESTIAKGISELNSLLATWYGYDAVGRFFVEPSQDDLDDTKKPVLWNFRTSDPNFLSMSETKKTGEVYNNVVVCGQGSNYSNFYGRAYNADPASDCNIYKIGLKTLWKTESNLCSEKQCKDLAAFLLRQKVNLASSATIKCGQMFHLRENTAVTVQRDDLDGNPVQKYLVTGYSIPLSAAGEMSLTCASVSENAFEIKTEGGIG